jgi:hypothetical protein
MWVVGGWQGVLQYRDSRRIDTDHPPNFLGGNCFHNGTKRRASVDAAHAKVRDEVRGRDCITAAVIDNLVEDMLQAKAEARRTAEQLEYAVEELVAKAKRTLAHKRQSTALQHAGAGAPLHPPRETHSGPDNHMSYRSSRGGPSFLPGARVLSSPEGSVDENDPEEEAPTVSVVTTPPSGLPRSEEMIPPQQHQGSHSRRAAHSHSGSVDGVRSGTSGKQRKQYRSSCSTANGLCDISNLDGRESQSGADPHAKLAMRPSTTSSPTTMWGRPSHLDRRSQGTDEPVDVASRLSRPSAGSTEQDELFTGHVHDEEDGRACEHVHETGAVEPNPTPAAGAGIKSKKLVQRLPPPFLSVEDAKHYRESRGREELPSSHLSYLECRDQVSA